MSQYHPSKHTVQSRRKRPAWCFYSMSRYFWLFLEKLWDITGHDENSPFQYGVAPSHVVRQ